MKIEIGIKFKPTFKGAPSLMFEVVEVEPENDYAKVKVTTDKGAVWYEDWDELQSAEMAFEIGDYTIC